MYYSELFGDACPQGGGYNPRPHPRTTPRGTFSLIPIPTGKIPRLWIPKQGSPRVDPHLRMKLTSVLPIGRREADHPDYIQPLRHLT